VELILVVVGAVIITAVSRRQGVQPALVIVVVGFAASFMPGFRGIELDSRVILSVVVPPLLYSAALDFSFPTFLRNIRPIVGLGVGLVAITAFAVAGITHWLVPTISFATALVIGAVVAPPDAVAAVAVGRELGLPRKVMAILTGESLVNDAAALAIFTFALDRVVDKHPIISEPLLFFAYGAVVGAVVGILLGYITLWIRRRLAHPGLETVQGLIVPFAAYLCAERVHASAVLAVVAAGFVVGRGSLEAGYQTRLQERFVWNSVDVLLEAFVFAYIGLQLRFVVQDMQAARDSAAEVVAVSAIAIAVVVLIRPPVVAIMFARWRWGDDDSMKAELPQGVSHRSRSKRDTRPVHRWLGWIAGRALTLQETVVVSWAGMRGVVTLAAAAGIPLHPHSGVNFAHRHTFQVVAFVVTVGTLLLQGATLPLIIRRLRPAFEPDRAADQAETLVAERLLGETADHVLDQVEQDRPPEVDVDTLREIRHAVARRAHAVGDVADADAQNEPVDVVALLYQKVLFAQRQALAGQRDAGILHDETVREMLDSLDLQEAGFTARLQRRL
jgi:monovalent cation/hydrogen antiporter